MDLLLLLLVAFMRILWVSAQSFCYPILQQGVDNIMPPSPSGGSWNKCSFITTQGSNPNTRKKEYSDSSIETLLDAGGWPLQN